MTNVHSTKVPVQHERRNMAHRQAGLTRENLSHLGLLVGGALALTVIQIHVLDW